MTKRRHICRGSGTVAPTARVRGAATAVASAVKVVLAVAALSAAVLAFGPRALGWHSVVVLSGSMEPALRTGGVAFVEPVEAGDIRAGDVITFASGAGRTITHRVVRIVATPGGTEFVTKGDANSVDDPERVRAPALVGKVKLAWPYLGWLVHWLFNERLVLAAPMAVAAALLLGQDLRTPWPRRRRRVPTTAPYPAPTLLTAPGKAVAVSRRSRVVALSALGLIIVMPFLAAAAGGPVAPLWVTRGAGRGGPRGRGAPRYAVRGEVIVS